MPGCRALTAAEEDRVFETISGRYALRDKALFMLGLKSGFRISELLSLKVGQFFTPDGYPADEITVEKESMKGKKRARTCPIHPKAREAVEAWITKAALTNEEYLFKSQQGLAIDRRWAWRLFKRVFTALGFRGKVSLHSMRKSFATAIYYATDKDLIATRDIIGHSKVETTEKYIGISNDIKRNAIERI